MGRAWRVASETYALLKGLPRNRGLLFWIVVFPLLFYGLMVAIWGAPSAPEIRVGVYNADRPGECGAGVSMSGLLLRSMNESGLFSIEIMDSRASVLEAVRHGRLDAGLLVPENFTCGILTGAPPTVTVVGVKGSWSNYSVSVLEGFIDGFSDRLRTMIVENATKYIQNYTNRSMAEKAVRWLLYIAEPINVEMNITVPPLLATPGGIRAFYALGMIGVEALFIGLSVGVSSVASRRQNGSLRLILSSPVGSLDLLMADTLAALTGLAIASAVILLASVPLGASYRAGGPELAVSALLIVAAALFVIGLGLLLAPLARTAESVTIIVNSIAFPVMFLGGIVIPREVLPEWARAFSAVFPHSRLLEAVRLMLIYGYKPAGALEFAAPALIATLAVYIVGAAIFVRLLERSQEY